MSQLSTQPPIAGTEGEPGYQRESRWVERRITVIWALLFFNGLQFAGVSLLPLPRRVGQLITAAALALAVVLALALNRRMVIRPNLVLGLATLLAFTALMTSIRGTAGAGALVRCARLFAFLFALWLLTPWWGRRDLLLARCHLRALVGVIASVVAGALIAPSTALGGRLQGVIWPIPPTQVAEFAALAAGMTLVLWLSGSAGRRQALLLGGGGIVIVVLTHTRTALVGLAVGLFVAGLSLFLSRRRVRRALAVLLIAAPLAVVTLAPTVSSWVTREQTADDLRNLTGRKTVWSGLLSEPRSDFNKWFGFGLSDKSFDGNPIDSTWLAVYQDEGLVGVVVVSTSLLFLLVAPAFLPAGRERALAFFIAAYCACASYTEVGLGDASPYVLHTMVVASLLLPEARHGPDDVVGQVWANRTSAK